MIEMLYHLQLDAALGSNLHFMGLQLDAAAPTNWGVAMLVMLLGIGMFEMARRRFAAKWGDTQQAIEIDLKRREAV